MKNFINYFLISLLIIIGITFVKTGLSLAQDNTIMNDTDGFSTFQCTDNCDTYPDEYRDKCKQYCGEYGIDDFVLLGIKLTKIMLGLVGTLAFGAFVYGGVYFLASAGRKDWIDKGKSAMTNAVIGLVIVFSSYLIIQFTLQTLGYTQWNSWSDQTKPFNPTNPDIAPFVPKGDAPRL